MAQSKNLAAQMLGALGGRSRSGAKVRAARANLKAARAKKQATKKRSKP